jgi:hypothetical protein
MAQAQQMHLVAHSKLLANSDIRIAMEINKVN